MLKIAKDLFSAWNDAGLLYCHWKSNEHLLPGLMGDTDLDVLLSQKDKERGESILRSLDYLQCESKFGPHNPHVVNWIGFDGGTGKLIHIHLHYALVTGHGGFKEYTLPWTEEALSTRVYDDTYGVYMIEPNLELVTLFTRLGLKDSTITKGTRREIDWLYDRVNMARVKQLLDTCYGEKSEAMFSLMTKKTIQASDYALLRRITKSTFKKYRSVKCFVRVREFAFKLVRRFIPVMSKKVPASGKGLTVVFLGQDGAGKTTVTHELMKWWSWKMEVRYVYMGIGANYNSLKKRLLLKIQKQGILRFLRAFLRLSIPKNVAKESYKNVVKAEKFASKGGLVIFDRFPQTEFAGISDGPKIRKMIQENLGKGFFPWLFASMANTEEKYIRKTVSHHPDVVIKLVLPPEESIRRKPQENYEAVKQKHEIIKSLKFEHSDVYTIDATMPFEEELVMIKNIIWQHIH